MPRIEVYRGNGNVIPVDVARKSKAFQCPFTSKIFTSKRDYVNHLSKHRKELHNTIRVKNLKKMLMETFYSLDSFNNIIKWIEMNPTVFYDNAINLSFRKNTYRDSYWIEILELKLSWKESVSNSHNCPENGVTNWGGNDTFSDGSPKPRGYSGWSGKIVFRTSHDLGFGSDVFRGLRINTGSGGGGHNKAEYEVIFFDDDWKNLYTKNVKDIIIQNALLNENNSIPSFYYSKWSTKVT